MHWGCTNTATNTENSISGVNTFYHEYLYKNIYIIKETLITHSIFFTKFVEKKLISTIVVTTYNSNVLVLFVPGFSNANFKNKYNVLKKQ